VDPALPAVRVARPDHLVQFFLQSHPQRSGSGGNFSPSAPSQWAGTIRVIFEDTGCGMTAEEMLRLFDPFTPQGQRDASLGLAFS